MGKDLKESMNIIRRKMGCCKRESNRISRAENSIWNKKVWLDGLNRIRENEDMTMETIHEVHKNKEKV